MGAKNHLKVNQHRHFKQTVDRVIADISVSDVCGCGDNCDREFLLAYYACPRRTTRQMLMPTWRAWPQTLMMTAMTACATTSTPRPAYPVPELRTKQKTEI